MAGSEFKEKRFTEQAFKISRWYNRRKPFKTKKLKKCEP